MTDYTVRVVAETKEADEKVKKLDRNLNTLEKDRKIHIEIPSISATIENIKELGTTLQTTYKIARNAPVVGPRIQDIEQLGEIAASTGQKIAKTFQIIASSTPSNILTTTFTASTAAVSELAKRLSNLGFALFGITESINVVRAAFGGMFDETVGREIKLRESILRTKTTLASTAKVIRNGQVIAEPFQAIAALDKPINKTIDSIRTRSLSIAGTTSDAIIQVFGTVATSISSVGGSLKDAEDLAISFSAALGTMGLSDPYYAVQEIRSIMTGTIDNNSILARSLGLTSEDINKAKTSAEGLVKFLQRRLAAFTAGQSVAAKAYAGLTSNIQEFSEEFKRAFGRELLDPLLEGLTILYQRFELIFKSAFGISSAVGKAFGAIARGVVGAAAAAPSLGSINNEDLQKGAKRADELAANSTVAIQDAVDRLRPQIALLSDEFIKAFTAIALALSKLAKGFAIFKFEQFKVYLAAATNLATILNNTVIPAVAGLISIYGELLKMPVVQYLSQVGAQFDVLNRAGIIPLAKTLFVLSRILPGVIDTFRKLGQAFTWIKVQLAGLIDIIITGFSAAIAGAATLISNLGRAIISGLMVGIAALLSGLKAVVLQLGVFLVQVAVLVEQAAPQFGALAVSIAQVGKALLGVELAFDKAQLAVAEFGLKTANALDALQLKTEQVRGKVEGVGQSLKDGIGGAAKSVGQSISGMVTSFLWFSAQLVLLQVAITILVDAFSKLKRAQQEISDQTRAELAVKRLSTAYADLGENATAAQRALKELEQQKLTDRIDALKTKIGELDAAIERATQLQRIKNFGDMLRNVAASLNFNNLDVRPQLKENGTQETFAEALLRTRTEQYKKAQEELNRLAEAEERLRKQEQIAEDIKLQAANRVNIEKEIGELKRQIDNDLFQQRQTQAQKEVEIFQAAGELRILQLEQANAKLIEGEEGASRAALEALNNYISTRERGELEIEAAKKTVAIEAANLERQVADYRLAMENKIFELRKRAGENDIKSAQLRRQQLEAAAKIVPGGSVRGGAIVTNRNDPDGEQTGSDIVLKGGIGAAIQNPFSNLRITKVGQQGSGSGTSGRGFGNYVTGEAVLNGKKFEVLLGHLNETVVRVGDVLESGAVIGTQGITGRATGPHVSTHVNALNGGNASSVLSAIENAWVKGGTIQSSALTQAPKAEALQSSAGIPDQSAVIGRYTEAVRSLASAMERLRALQAALTDARTAAAFDAIAKAAFQPVALEQYQDELTQVQLNYEAVSAATADAFNPERTRIAIEQAVKVKRSDQELLQIRTAITAQTNLSEKEKAQLVKLVTDQHRQYVQSLQQEELARQRIQTTQKASDTLQRLKEETAQTYREIELIKLRNGLEYEGISPEKIAAEEAKLQIRQELEKLQRELNQQLQTELVLRDELLKKLPTATEKEKERLQKDLDAALKEIERLRKMLEGLPAEGKARAKAEDDKAAASTKDPIQSLLGRWKSELEDTRSMVASLAQTIQSELASAMSNAVIGVIDGTTTVGEAFGQMFKNIGKAFVDMAMEMLSKMLMMYIMKNLLGGLLGGGATGGGGGGPTSPAFAPPAFAAEGAYWSGGFRAFANGGMVNRPTLGLVGEGGEPEYIIPASKMRAAMGRYAGGARGAAVIPGNGENGGGGMGAAPSGTIDVRYSIERINNVDYVTADQFQRGMAQAAQQGAIQGERRAMRTLGTSPATRRRIGI